MGQHHVQQHHHACSFMVVEVMLCGVQDRPDTVIWALVGQSWASSIVCSSSR